MFAPATIGPALVAFTLWVLVFLQYPESFKGIFGVSLRWLFDDRALGFKNVANPSALATCQTSE